MGKHRIIGPIVRAVEKALLTVPFLVRLYIAPYKTVVQKEVDLAKLSPGERVLQIGAGSIPFSAIYLAQLAHVSVCAIDIDRYAVDRAKRWIQKLGLAHRIQIRVGDGRNFPLEGFTAAFVALQAEPKKEIMSHLMNEGRDGIRVVIREPREKFLSQYDKVPTNRFYRDKTKQDMVTFSSSLLFTKEEIEETGYSDRNPWSKRLY